MEMIENIRHSTAHILAQAVQKLFKDVKLGIGPTIENGFYYDFDLPQQITEEDLKKIEEEMKKIIKQKQEFEQEEITKVQGIKLFEKQPYKIELIEEISEKGEKLTKVQNGPFIDFCRGGHVKNTSELGNFKLLKLAGAYWKGNAKNRQLQRIYGTAWETKEELKEYLQMLEEAKKRDHKVIGEQQEIYMISNLIGKGLPIWLPNGEIIKEQIENFVKETEKNHGYLRVCTPHLAKEELFLKSGHLPHYEESMYPKMVMDDGTYYLKAMNCPLHHLIYNKKQRSYKELPLRLAEYGTVYRNELSGTLSGLSRVRMLSMNDAHIYCTKEQIEDEVKGVIQMIEDYYKIFNFKNYHYRLSLWNKNNKEKYINEPENWDYTEKKLRKVLKELNTNFKEIEDEAAFYGPKIDIQFKNVYGKEETMSTIQLDFAAKSRFNLKYVDNDSHHNNEVFVIHRAPLSTHERFIAYLIEHYAGKFPIWLSPIQIVVMTVADRHIEYAKEIAKEFEKYNLRVEVDGSGESIAKKVRNAIKIKIPYQITIGDKELGNPTLAIRTRENKIIELDKEEFIEKIKVEIKEKC
ncbi:threonine--tRNA ligase [Candidatus Woesearchaeota archaeon]|nr:threonine--tRNA ligase [Candidatus Woesearchaeota archaeon]